PRDWSSDVCSSDLSRGRPVVAVIAMRRIGFSRVCSSMTCAMSPGVRAIMKMPLNPACFIPRSARIAPMAPSTFMGERFFCSAACAARRLNLAACYLELPAAKPYRDFIRAGLSARLADLVDVGALAAHPDVIGVETGDVRHSGNQRAVAIDVDVVRGSSIPGEVHRLLPMHLVAARTERDLPRCRSRRRGWRRSGCWCGCRCRCGRRSRSSCREDANVINVLLVLAPVRVEVERGGIGRIAPAIV